LTTGPASTIAVWIGCAALPSLCITIPYRHHGFCCSYQEVQRFEANAAQSHGIKISNLTTEFVQYGADNVDHNICTLDGHGTFYGMGIIAAVTPETSLVRLIPRVKVTSLDVTSIGKVQIHFHKEESCGMSAVTYYCFTVTSTEGLRQHVLQP